MLPRKIIITAGFGLPLLVLSGLSAASCWSMTLLVEANSIPHTQEVSENLEDILTIPDNNPQLKPQKTAIKKIEPPVPTLQKFAANKLYQHPQFALRESLAGNIILITYICRSFGFTLLCLFFFLLNRKNTKRQQAEHALRKANEELQSEVQQRTAELLQANEALHAKIAECKCTEDQLRLFQSAIANPNDVVTIAEAEPIDEPGPRTVYVNEAFTRMAGYTSTGDREANGLPQAIRSQERLPLTQFSVDRAVNEIFWIGPDARFVYVNDATCRSLGYSREELLSMSVLDIEPDVSPQVWQNRWQAIAQNRFLLFESRHRSKEGRIFPVEIAANYLRFNDKEFAYYFAWHISDSATADSFASRGASRKQAELALRESEERFRVALKNSPIFVFNQDTNLRYTWIYNSPFGIPAAAIVGKLESEINTLEDGELLADLKRQVMRTGVGMRQETQIRVNGKDWYYDFTVEPLHNLEGEITGITCAAVDITEIRAREIEQRAIFDGALEAIIIADDEGRYVEANPAACQLFGVRHSELLGRQIADFIEPHGDFQLGWHISPEPGEVTGEWHLWRPDRTLREVEYAAKVNFLRGRHLAVLRDITLRKQAEEELIRISKAVESASDAIAMADIYGQSIYHNKAFLNLLEYTPNALNAAGGLVTAFVDAEVGVEIFDTLMRGNSWNGDVELQSLSGRKALVSLRADAIKDREDNSLGFLAICTDITLRKQAEEVLRESEARFRQLADSAPVMVWMSGPDTLSTFFNQPWLIFTGRTLEQQLGNGWSEGVHPEDVQQCLDIYLSAFNARVPYRNEYRLRRADGEYRWVLDTGVALLTPEGGFAGYIGSCIDIMERKQAEEALRDSQRFIQQIADTTPTMIYIFDLSQVRNTYLNLYCQDFFGLSGEEIPAKEPQFLEEFLHSEDRGKFSQLKEKLSQLKEGEVLEEELHLKNAKGEWRWFHSRMVIFSRNAEGVPKQMLGTAVDITELKQAEEIRLALEKEKELSQLQRSFFSMISHEFRTPLSTILLSVQSLQESYERWPKEKIFKNIQRIQGSAKNMSHLIEDILTISRAEAGKLEWNREFIDLENLCSYLVEEMQAIAANHQQKITFISQGKCQDAYMDEKLLRSILNNLLANAIKYSASGRNVYFSLSCDRADAIFQIRDEGSGIPLEDLPHLFEPFHRGKNVGAIAGSGLGLTVVKKCVELHGGEISVTSQVGVGTTFTVTIPYQLYPSTSQ